MKPWIKILIGVVAGFAGGFASGFLVHKKMNDIQFEEIDEETMAEIEQNFKEDMKTAEEAKDILDKINASIEKADPQNEDELRNALQGKIPYSKAEPEIKEKYSPAWETVRHYSDEENADSMPIDPEDGLDEDFLESLEEEEIDPGRMEEPHIISLSEFYNERPEYDKITIDWYEPDDVYLDEREELIADIDSYIGMSAKKLFSVKGPDEDPDICFVRNEGYGSDYEVIRHHRSWKETSGEE